MCHAKFSSKIRAALQTVPIVLALGKYVQQHPRLHLHPQVLGSNKLGFEMSACTSSGSRKFKTESSKPACCTPAQTVHCCCFFVMSEQFSAVGWGFVQNLLLEMNSKIEDWGHPKKVCGTFQIPITHLPLLDSGLFSGATFAEWCLFDIFTKLPSQFVFNFCKR